MSNNKRVPGKSWFKFWRWVWGVLTLLALLWVVLGVSVTGISYFRLADIATSALEYRAYALGTVLNLMFFMCTGVSLALLFRSLYRRNGVRLREAWRHEEMLETQRGHE